MIDAMSEYAEPILLDDARMQHFIDQGYVTLQTSLPRSYHDELYATLERVIAAEGNPGNNLLRAFRRSRESWTTRTSPGR